MLIIRHICFKFYQKSYKKLYQMILYINSKLS